MDTVKRNISSNLKEYRERNNLTQEELAERIGISVTFYSEIERGKKLPSSKLIVKIYREMELDYIPLSNNTYSSELKELFSLVSHNPHAVKILLKIAKNLKK